MEVVEVNDTALPIGSLILGGQYRLVQLLHQRPRVNLYLGRRLPRHLQQGALRKEDEEHIPLVAIRELVCTGLPHEIRTAIEQATFEEFVSPAVLGSPRLPCAGDRMRSEGERHYLVMQLGPGRKGQQAMPVTLEELLSQEQWPSWLNMKVAMNWGAQLCRIVARLHRLGIILGDLDPATILVDSQGLAEWVPILLVSWPPAPEFWPTSSRSSTTPIQPSQIFPIAISAIDNPFAAPEVRSGVIDERADIYSLGAILYLLLARYAPSAAFRRRLALQPEADHNSLPEARAELLDRAQESDGLALIPPRLLNANIAPAIEHILLRALSLDPLERYASAFELAEAIESFGY